LVFKISSASDPVDETLGDLVARAATADVPAGG
jgi:hypothetical protein